MTHDNAAQNAEHSSQVCHLTAKHPQP